MHAVRVRNGEFILTTTDGDTNVRLPINYNNMAYDLYLTVRNGILYGLSRSAAHCFVLYEIYTQSFRTIDTICRCNRPHDRIRAYNLHVRDEPSCVDMLYGCAMVTVDWDTLKLTRQLVSEPPGRFWFWGTVSTYDGLRRVYVNSRLYENEGQINIVGKNIMISRRICPDVDGLVWSSIERLDGLHIHVWGGTNMHVYGTQAPSVMKLDLITGETTVSHLADGAHILSSAVFPDNVETLLQNVRGKYVVSMHNTTDGTHYATCGGEVDDTSRIQLLNQLLDTNKYEF